MQLPTEWLVFYAALNQWSACAEIHFDQLYEHFLATGEMPYGVAKARDGDPMQWISDRLDEIYKEQFRAEKVEGEV
jgi:hypothetical protein